MVEYYPQILRQYLGEERGGSNQVVDKTTKHAVLITGASQSASEAAKAPEPVNRKERSQYNQLVRPFEEIALNAWSKKEKLWISEENFNKEYWNRKIGEGAEQKVYLNHDGKTVLKVNTASFHGTWLDYLNRLVYHSVLFPSTKYTTIGFTTENAMFAIVTEQTFAILDNGAPRINVELYLNHSWFHAH
jgi:hypothetical protein